MGWLTTWVAKAEHIFSGNQDEPLALVPRRPNAPSAVFRSAHRDAQLAHQCRSALGSRASYGTRQHGSALGFGVIVGTL